jgi:N-acetylmuramoyl-L-alanine amidase
MKMINLLYPQLLNMMMIKSFDRHKSSALSWVLALLVLLLDLSTPLTAGAATPRTGLEGRYDQAKVYHRKVAGSKSLATERQNWLTAIRNFRKIYQNNRSHRLAPPSLLRVGLIYQEMFGHFNNPLDLGEAIAYYEDLISLYAKSRLADDALFAIANIYLENRQAEKKAARLLNRLIKRYPNGDMVPEALTILAKLGVGNSRPTPVLQAGQKKKKAQSNSRASANKTSRAVVQAELKPIRHWSNKNYTRVVIETTGKVKYKENLLKKTANAPRRLYVDLENCQIAPELQDPI